MCSERCASSSVHLDQECQLLKKLELKVSLEDPEGHIIYCVSCILGVGHRLGGWVLNNSIISKEA